MTADRPSWRGAVLFDWDGTLVDSRTALVAAWHDVTTEVLGQPWPLAEEDVRVVLSRRGVEVFPLLTDDPDRVQALSERFTPAYERHAADGVRPFPGALELLEELGDRLVAVAVVTSKARVRYTADASRGRLDHLVGAVACAEDVLRGKPDPQAVHHVLGSLRVPLDSAVLVGDTTVDMETARAAGIRSIGVTWGASRADELREAGADALVSTFDELRDALRTGPLAV